MSISETIKKSRLALNLSDSEVAQCTGMSIYEYGDIESYNDELETAVELSKVRLLCKCLDINLFDVFSVKDVAGKPEIGRNKIVKESRVKKT